MPQSTPKHLPADERRAATVRAVIELAADRNPADITTAAIAQHMRLTQGALFRHFPSKEAIWDAVMAHTSETLLARIDAAAARAVGPRAALEAMFHAHVDFIASHPGVPRILFAELQHDRETPAKTRVLALLEHYRERLLEQVRRGIDRGELQDTPDADALPVLFVGMIQGLVIQSMLAGDIRRMKRQAPALFALFLQGIGARP
ncbi:MULTISPECIES: TetR/AcrR family transcriptional regulator [Castellaniella]|jgi:AcrR family transcriptional regulator|uniref:Transcriptional regulator, TetR family n=3 Tax=Castellaniella TaxID=359336 RepID=W8WZI8_CASD6|nr:TetR/AcrR family transcriptional regulator [Castellaniella defragrans]KAB0610619.1 TetR/AcrR family transcriptional regulator [Castellaniella defragrans]MBB6083140.1 AcrR family transcriptional regulator [Castellaniella defragrans]CDM25029.1 Transcriptional regulator, TetR family [Castellaniella defragrans 65Phen]